MLAGVDNGATVAQEEIFGPVVAITRFEDEKDAIRLANDSRYGLMATVWTGDPARGHRLARRIQAGTIAVNHPYSAFPGIPFGGYKESGFGRELGLETLDEYLETKSVLVSTGNRRFNPFGLTGERPVPLGRAGRRHGRAGELLRVHDRASRCRPRARDEYGLSLTEVGVVLAAQWIGTTVTLLPWGLLADRIGERLVLAIGLTLCGALLLGLALVPPFPVLVALLIAGGAAGASVNSASGRAVMQWFDAGERGLALGIRQTAIPLGGVTTSLVLPTWGSAPRSSSSPDSRSPARSPAPR